MAETYRPNAGMQEAAKRALGWMKEGKAGSGFTAVGRKRASDIASGNAMSAEIVIRMYSFFARHEVDKKATGFNSGEDGFPTAGRVAWDAWGGDAGFSWSTKIRNKLESNARALQLITSEEDEMTDTEAISDLTEELLELMADVVTFYYRAHGAHWNVIGTDFAEYHKLFLKIYEDTYESIDPIAENLRKLGMKAPFKLQDFIALRSIDDSSTDSQDARVLATDLLLANDEIIDSLSYVFDCANNNRQQGIANFIAGRIESHQNWKWQLSASLGMEVENPTPEMPEEEIGEDMADAVMPMEKLAYSADVEDSETRAGITKGSFVSWRSSGGTARGKIESVVTNGEAKSSEGYTINATPDSPAFVIRIFKEDGNGWTATDTTVVHKGDILTPIDALKSPRSEDMSMIEERKSAIATAEKITMQAEIRAMDTTDGSLRIGGYAATFNKEATGLNFREVIAPGAFKRTLATDNPVFLLINHDMEALPLASTRSGTLTLTEDEVGLRMDAELDPMNPRAAELASALRRGDVDKMSFAFTVAPDGDTRSEGLRTLTDLDLYEVSVVTLPAYDSTTVGMRSEQEEEIELRKKKLELSLKQLRLRK